MEFSAVRCEFAKQLAVIGNAPGKQVMHAVAGLPTANNAHELSANDNGALTLGKRLSNDDVYDPRFVFQGDE